jgi:drug/metabolite transporter (DMT)-like permease
MLMGGHGAVVWAEKWVPSSLTSVLIATVPLWMVLVDSLRNRSRPGMRVVAGLALGFAGVALLVDPVRTLGGGGVDALGAAIIVGGAFLWACGSLYSRSGKLPSSPLQATSLEMLAGGTLLIVASGMAGEWTRIGLDQVSTVSLLSWLYLIVFGSLVAFTCYIWLLKVVSTAKVSTYAYVNPIVAILLGWALANEPITTRNMLAAAIILAAVIVITTYRSKVKAVKEASDNR